MRARSLLRGVGWTLGSTFVFVGALVAHVHTAPGRRLASTMTNDLLAPSFKGRIVVDRIDELALSSGSIRASGRLFDPQGRSIAVLPSIRGRFHTGELLRSLAGGPLVIHVSDLHVDGGQLALLGTPTGGVSIAETFEPKTPSPPSPGPGPRVKIGPIFITGFRVDTDLVAGGNADVQRLEGNVGVDDDAVTLGLANLEARGTALDLPASDVRAKGTARLPIGAGNPKLDAEATVVHGESNVSASLSWNDSIAARVRGHIEPNAVRDFKAPLVPTESFELDASANGSLPNVTANVALRGKSTAVTVAANGNVTEQRARGTVDLSDVDLHAFGNDLPVSRIAGRVSFDGDGHTATASVQLHFDPGAIAGQKTPEIDGDAAYAANRVTARIRADEPGTHVAVDASADFGAAERPVTAHVVANSDLARVRAFVPGLYGSARVEGNAQVALTTYAVSGTIHGEVDRFAYGRDVRAAHVTFESGVVGTFAHPAAATHVIATNVHAGNVYADEVEGGGTLRIGSLIVDGAYARVRRGDTKLAVDAAHVRIGNGVEVENATVDGLGGPLRADIKSTNAALVAKVEGHDLHVEPLVALGIVPPDFHGGGDIDANVRLDRGGVTGTARIHAKDLRRGDDRLAGDVFVRGYGRELDVTAHIQSKSVGHLDVEQSRITIDGDARDPRTWARAAGTATAESDVDLDALARRYLNATDLKLTGRAHLRVQLDRKKPGGPFATTFALETTGFSLQSGEISVRDTELSARGQMDDRIASVDVDASDKRGPLLGLRAMMAVDPKQRKGKTLADAPLHASLVIPARSLDPITIGKEIQGARTLVAAVVETTGTIAEPHASGWLRADAEGAASLRIDNLDMTWDTRNEAMPHGTAHARARVALEPLIKRFGDAAKSLPQLAGVVDLDFTATRARGTSLPDARASVRTYGFRASTKTMALAGTDMRASAELHAETGEIAASYTAWDADGALLVADAKSQLSTPITLESIAAARSKLAELPISARVAMPPRSVANLPVLLADNTEDPGAARTISRLRKIEGGVAFDAILEGTLEKPNARFRAYGIGIRQQPNRTARKGSRAEREQNDTPIDMSLFARYDGEHTSAFVDVIDQKKSALHATAELDMSARELLAHGDAQVRGDVELHAHALRLAALPFVGSSVTGELDGDLNLKGYGEHARLEGSFQGRRFGYGRTAQFSTVDLRVLAADGRLSVAAGARQMKGGWAGLMLTSGVKWGAAAVPTLDDSVASRLEYRVDDFRLSGVRSLVRGVLPELDGTVAGRGVITHEHGGDHAEGALYMRNVSAYVPALGENVDDLSADIRLAPGAIYVENFFAKVDRGELRLAASGSLKGLTPQKLRANLKIPQRRALPIYMEGVRYGNVSGSLSAEVDFGGSETRVSVNVPKLKFELSDLDPRSLQSLDPADRIRIGVRAENGALESVRLQRLDRTQRADGEATAVPSRPLIIDTHIGELDVAQGNMIYIPVRGDLQTIIRDDLRLKGRIELQPGGIINIKGRKFEVDSGTVTWTGSDSPANPTVLATAKWEAPDQSFVFASYTGPAQSGKLDLRSEPAHSQSEILSLLLFGTTDSAQSKSSNSGGVAAQAGSVAGGVATGGLSQAFSKLSHVEIEAKIENAESGGQTSTRPEVGVRVRSNVVLQVGTNLSPTPAFPDRFLGTVDYRFFNRWSVVWTEGDAATSILDLLWQYRY